jgi:hypothetical protein
MKKPKSTKNKDKPEGFDFEGATKDNENDSPIKRKMTDDGEEDKAGHLTDRKNIDDDKGLDISSDSSENEVKISGANTYGFVSNNNISSKLIGKGIKNTGSKQISLTTSKNKNVKSQFRLDHSNTLKFKQPMFKGNPGNEEETKVIKNQTSMDIAQDWQNDRHLDVNPNHDLISKRSKKSKGKIDSKNGSITGGRKYKKMPLSVQSKRNKYNSSKNATRRVLHNSKSVVIFNEFKNEEKVNQEIGVKTPMQKSKR